MDKALNALTMARRAGKIEMGFDVVKKAIREDKAELVIIAGDLSPKTKKEVIYLCSSNGVEIARLDATMDELWYLIGKRTGVMALTDGGFKKSFEGGIIKGEQEELDGNKKI